MRINEYFRHQRNAIYVGFQFCYLSELLGKTQFKSDRTLKNILMAPKEKIRIEQMSEVVYWFRSSRFKCDEEYTGESATSFGVPSHSSIPRYVHVASGSSSCVTLSLSCWVPSVNISFPILSVALAHLSRPIYYHYLYHMCFVICDHFLIH